MPRLPSPKLEAFACELAQGMSPIDAAERAGFTRSKSHASERYRRADVQDSRHDKAAVRRALYQFLDPRFGDVPHGVW